MGTGKGCTSVLPIAVMTAYVCVHVCVHMQGIKQVFASQCWHKSLTPLMEQIRNDFKDIPTYFTFDIDGLEATNCPGAGMCSVGRREN